MTADWLIAVVDDDDSARDAIVDLLKALDFVVAGFRGGVEFLASDDLLRTACVIADVRMPGMSGIDLCSRIAASGLAIPTILITAYPDETTRARALGAGVGCYLIKPLEPDKLLACLFRVLPSRRMGAG